MGGVNSKPTPEFSFDGSLREIPVDATHLRAYVDELILSLAKIIEPTARVRCLGEIGVNLRILGDLKLAEENIQNALKMVFDFKLGLPLEIQQKIRLANILQWKREFDNSNALFSEILATCRSSPAAGSYLDFALQHAAKNLFDQKKYSEALASFEEVLSIRKSRKAPQDQIESTQLAIQITKKLLS